MQAVVMSYFQTSAWIMQIGIMDFLCSGAPEVRLMLARFVFILVPMLNPDGVVVGNYRVSLSGQDLNRVWRRPDAEVHPEIFYTLQMLARLRRERGVSFFTDIHGHSQKLGSFLYGCDAVFWPGYPASLPGLEMEERLFPARLAERAGTAFSFDHCNFLVSRAKESTGRVVVWRSFTQRSFTLESSLAGTTTGMHYSITDYELLGRRVVEAMADVMVVGPDVARAKVGPAWMLRIREHRRAQVLGLDRDDSADSESGEDEAAAAAAAAAAATAALGSDAINGSHPAAATAAAAVGTVGKVGKMGRPRARDTAAAPSPAPSAPAAVLVTPPPHAATARPAGPTPTLSAAALQPAAESGTRLPLLGLFRASGDADAATSPTPPPRASPASAPSQLAGGSGSNEAALLRSAAASPAPAAAVPDPQATSPPPPPRRARSEGLLTRLLPPPPPGLAGDTATCPPLLARSPPPPLGGAGGLSSLPSVSSVGLAGGGSMVGSPASPGVSPFLVDHAYPNTLAAAAAAAAAGTDNLWRRRYA